MAGNYEPHGYLRKILSPGETVLEITRQHGIFLFGRLSLWLLAVAVIFGFVSFLASRSGDGAPMIGIVLAILPLLVIWWQWLEWANHAYVLTNRRVIQMHGVLSKAVVDSLLEKLNDIKTDQSLLGRMFDYGDVSLLTANSEGDNIFRNIKGPITFKTRMLEAKQALESQGVH